MAGSGFRQDPRAFLGGVLPVLVAVGFVLLTGYQVWDGFWARDASQSSALEGDGAQASQDLAGSPPSASAPMPDPAMLHLFGRFETTKPELPSLPVEPVMVRAPRSDLALQVTGVVWVPDDPDATRVMIAGESGDGIYAVGSALPGGAEIVEIRSREVIIRRAGKLESLEVPETGDAAGKSSSRSRSRVPGRRLPGVNRTL